MSAPIELFLTGLALGAGPCSLICLPILLPFIAGTREGLVEGVKATLAFSLSRLAAYTALGFGAGLSGEQILSLLTRSELIFYVWILAGLVIAMLGFLILLGKEVNLGVYRFLFRHAIDDSSKSMALVGFMIGFTPCAPLLGILTYIAFTVKSPLTGALYALCFGLGASVVTPISVLGIVSGVAPKLIFRNPLISKLFRRSCGFLLILLGLRLIVSQTEWWW